MRRLRIASIGLTLVWWAQSLLYHNTDVNDQYLTLVSLFGTPKTAITGYLSMRFHWPL